MKKQFLNAAEDIGIKLCRDAIWENERCNWVTIDKGIDGKKTEYSFFRSLGGNFYDGTSGVALFLASLASVSEEPVFMKTAIGALNQALSTRQKMAEYPSALLGFHVGWVGIAYTSIYIGRKTGMQKFVEAGLEMIATLAAREGTDYGLDVIDGIAGALPAFIQIYQAYPEHSIREFVIKLGDTLLEKAEKEPNGWSWNTISEANRNLTGFAHGVAGIMHALLELYGFTKEKRYLDAAYEGWRYERHCYNDQEKNWPDFRKFSHSPQDVSYPCLWCHGAAGIGLSRARAYQVTNDPAFKEEAYSAINTTMEKTAFGNSLGASLCHGVMGNLELLLFASTALDDPGLAVAAEELGIQGYEMHIKKGMPWVNGLHNTYQVPGFMLGLAGIGYQYLRLYGPLVFPSCLIMNPGHAPCFDS